ncbi:putative E3 ubiquitin ligase [Handroanthus impetiginosus]|uniref:Putative E3 ubiquitin ligase n=1 Tax=Handroanthus impetiginosus TaxID=429701 RepID=A0A2G9GE11_9LAMI|nr:putative E3 ubiquitin ligase [Handroanthus impetiginosus]
MGNKSSSPRDGGSWRQSSMTHSSPASGWQHDYAQSSYSQYAQNYPVEHPYPPGYPPPNQYSAPQNYGTPSESYAPPQNSRPPSQLHATQKKFDRRYSRIADNYRSLEEVTEALARAGLESSNLIIGIDFTKSNEWTGKRSNNGRSLHHIGSGLNPYEQAISIIGKTLAAFDDDNLIPCFGFGDASTHDQDVFSFYPDGRFCNGFEEVLSRYREIIPNLKLAGPTSFAPIIEMAMTIVEQSGGQYHVLVIIADGQVTRSVDTENGQLSPQEQKTVKAIVEASKLPLSIVLVGVGDGPWDMMKEFDDNIPARDFDNFQFVNFTEIMSKNVHQSRKETEFALAALMEIPSQYKATMELNLLGQKGNTPERVALPPPVYGAAFGSVSKPSRATSFQHSSSAYYKPHVSPDAAPSVSAYYKPDAFPDAAPPVGAYYKPDVSPDVAPSAPRSTYEHQICPICLTNPKDMAFGCGHQTCCECGRELQLCPICRSPIETRIKLY